MKVACQDRSLRVPIPLRICPMLVRAASSLLGTCPREFPLPLKLNTGWLPTRLLPGPAATPAQSGMVSSQSILKPSTAGSSGTLAVVIIGSVWLCWARCRKAFDREYRRRNRAATQVLLRLAVLRTFPWAVRRVPRSLRFSQGAGAWIDHTPHLDVNAACS